MNILILGASGMLGHVLFHVLNEVEHFNVVGSIRSFAVADKLKQSVGRNCELLNINVLNQDEILDAFARFKPDYVINCIGIIKQYDHVNNPLLTLPINAMLPHQLANICALAHAKLIHISTDCVFSGSKGNYQESDISDATDLYGRSKHMGEVVEAKHALTLRTSIIGHELSSSVSLMDWFLSQQKEVRGFSKAIYSGLTTLELSRVIRKVILNNPSLSGLYHVSSKPIDKYSLLQLVKETYQKDIIIHQSDDFKIDRSLCSDKFYQETGYLAPTWPSMIESLYQFKSVHGDLLYV